jgi:hypothetical protein
MHINCIRGAASRLLVINTDSESAGITAQADRTTATYHLQ